MMPKPVTRDNLIGKYIEFHDKRCTKSKMPDCKYMIGKVKRIVGKKKITVTVEIPYKKRIRIKREWIIGTITHSGLRRMIEW